MYYTCMSHQNVHILLPHQLLQLLRGRAKREQVSIGELIRRAVKQVYAVAEPSAKRKAFQRLAGHHELQMTDWDTVKADLLKRYE